MLQRITSSRNELERRRASFRASFLRIWGLCRKALVRKRDGDQALDLGFRMAYDQEDGMAVDTASLFASVIQEHLELRRRNAALEHEMPLERYMPDDPFENHPLFKTEEQARIEDTMDGAPPSIIDEPTSLDWGGNGGPL